MATRIFVSPSNGASLYTVPDLRQHREPLLISSDRPNPLYPKALDLSTWSQVGKRAQVAVPDQSQPTMNYGSLTDDSRESEFCRSIVHEFGHAIGCVHEHQAWKIDWNVPRVESDCLARYGWDKGTTQKQIINTWESINSLERSDFDANSIMCYYYPAEWTNDHTSAPTNLKLSATDRSFIGRIYPFQTRDQGELSIDPEIRKGYPLTALNSKAVSFVPPYHDVPRIAVGLKSLDIGNSGHIRIRAQAVEVTEDEFVVNVDTWMDTQLFNATATWIEFGPEDSDYQGECPQRCPLSSRYSHNSLVWQCTNSLTSGRVQHAKFPAATAR